MSSSKNALFAKKPRPSQLEQIAPLAILGLALFLRLFRLSEVPGGLNGDELFNAIDALRVGKEHWPIFFEGNNGREAFFLYSMALSLRLLGETIFAIRLPAVLLGSGSVWLAYRIGQTQFNRRVGLVGAGLTAVSLWPLMEARWGLRAVSLTFMTALTLHLLWLGFRYRRRRDWLLGGGALGLTMYTYIPSRAFPLVVLAWFGWLFWSRREAAQKQVSNMLLSLLAGGLVFAPFGFYMWQFPEKANQRIGGLSVALNDALQGNFGPLGESLLGVARMFSFHGDIEWRYHLSGQPVFDPITSVFFYVGLFLCLWLAFSRQAGADKRPSYALLLLWAGAMLAPNAILEANSSFLRAAGAIVPLYLITAVGFDTLASFAQGRWPRLVRPATVAVIAVIGLSFILARTWRDYFTVWNTQADVRRIYQQDLAEIGRFLNAHPPPENTRVFIADPYGADLAPKTFAYHSDYPVEWFNVNTGFALNQPDTDEDTWVFVTINETVPNPIQNRLDLETAVETINFAEGDPAFKLYRLTPGALALAPQQEQVVDFVDGPRLLGYDLPDELLRGSTIPVMLHWQIPPDKTSLPNQLTFAQVRLEDAQGNQWSQNSNLLGYPQASWQSGDRFIQLLPLDIPEGMPPGPAHLRFDLHDSDGALYPIAGVAAANSNANRSAELVVRSQPLADFTPPPDMLVLDDTLALKNATFSSLITPGLTVNIGLEWVALSAPEVDYKVQLALALPGSETPLVSQRFDIWPGVYPPSQWQAGEQISSFHRLQVPLDLPTDAAPELRLHLLAPDEDAMRPVTQGSSTLAQMELVVRQHRFDVPPISRPVTAVFGDSIRLLGYDLDTSDSHPNGEVRLTLYWQAIETPPDHYTVFNHIPGPDGRLRGQFDSPPSGEAWLTGTWLPDEVVVDERVIPIRAGAENGRYPLIIGLYTANDGVRLPVTVDGEPQPNHQLVLTEIEIAP